MLKHKTRNWVTSCTEVSVGLGLCLGFPKAHINEPKINVGNFFYRFRKPEPWGEVKKRAKN